MCRYAVRIIPKRCPDVSGMSVRMRPKYAAWHLLVDARGEIPTDSNIKAMLNNSCIAMVQETYDSLRTAKSSFAL